MTERVERIIFENLLGDEQYIRKVIPFLQDEYFDSRVDKTVFGFIKEFFDEHNQPPNKKIIKLKIEDSDKLKNDEYHEALELVDSLGEADTNKDWVVQRTEKFCKDKALFNAITQSIKILDGNVEEYNRDAIPSLLQEALAIAFDKSVGHDYLTDIENRYDFYHLKQDRIPFHLDIFNKITKGGTPRKTLNCILAGTNTGKSLFLTDHAAGALAAGYNCLYITMEMAEERISERIDCNLMDVTIDDLYKMKRDDFVSKLSDIKNKTRGQLVVKEYPTGGAHVGHFRALLDELKQKRNFVPDVVYVDYLNICASQKYKSNNYNSYFAIKAIAEELRGLAVEYNFCCWTATQANRGGNNNSDIETTDTSESFGTVMTLDFLVAMIRTEELDNIGQLMCKQLKSRYNSTDYYRRFVIGVELAKFKLYDIDDPTADVSEAGRTDDDEPIFDKSKFGKAMKARNDVSEINFD